MIRRILATLLRRAHRRLEAADAAPRAAQAAVHRRLARALAGTQAAALHPAAAWADLDAWRDHVRLTTHADYAPLIAQALAAPLPGAFERRPTAAFATSTSGAKHTPYTRAHFASLRAFQSAVLGQALVGRDLTALLDGRALVVQGSLELARTPGGALTGYSTALMVATAPWMLRRSMSPPLEVLRAPDPATRLSGVRDALVTARPTALSGIPEYVVGALRHLLAGPDAEAVRDALAAVRLYAWSGTPLGPLRAFLQAHLAPGAALFDAVSATEGPLGVQAEAPGVYRLALPHVLLLFVATDDPDHRALAHQLTPGRDYAVHLGSFSGLSGYATGDRVHVLSTDPVRFALLPRQLDVEAAWRALGPETTDFRLFRDATAGLTALIERPSAPDAAALATLAALAGASTATAHLLPPGHLTRAAFTFNPLGLVKLPWLSSRPDLAARILALP